MPSAAPRFGIALVLGTLRRRLPEAIALALLLLTLFSDTMLGGRTYFLRDVHLQWQPQIETFAAALASGALPLWDPYVSFGQPMLANPNVEVCYPFAWLGLVTPAWLYINSFAWWHAAVGALGVLLLARAYGSGRLGATLAAGLWVASGPLLSLVNVWSHFAGAVWFPWILLATERVVQSPRPRTTVWLGVAMALPILAGSPDYFLQAASVAGLRLAAAFTLSSRKRTLLAAATLAAVVGVGVSCVQWLPAAEIAAASSRRSLPAKIRLWWSMHPLSLWETVIAVPAHEPQPGGAASTLLYEGREPYLFSLYVGLSSLPLLVLGLRSRSSWVPIAMLALCILMALGRFTPIYEVASRLMPPLAMLRFPVKWMVPAALAWALLAARGIEAAARVRTRSLAAAVLLAGCAAAALPAAAYVDSGGLGAALRELATPVLVQDLKRALVFTAAFAAAMVLARRFPRLKRELSAVAVVAVVADPALTNRTINLTAPNDFYRYRPPALDLVDAGKLERFHVYDYRLSPARSLAHLGRPDPYRISIRKDPALQWIEAAAMRSYLAPNAPAGWGRFGSFDADTMGLQPPGLARLNAAFNSLDDDARRTRLLQVAGVSREVALHKISGLSPIRSVDGWFLNPIQGLAVPDPLPRTYFVSGSVPAINDAAGLETLLDPAFDPRGAIILIGDGKPPAGASCSGSSSIQTFMADRVVLEVAAPCAGYAVLLDAHDPSWRARVDEREAPLLRANVAFRAVPVPAGRHRVELRYRPTSVLLGFWVTVTSCLAVAVIAWRTRGSDLPTASDLGNRAGRGKIEGQ